MSITERTPDGHQQVWLLYRPEPFHPDSPEEQELNLWVRRADVFTSRDEAIVHLDNLIGRQVAWQPYNAIFPELWVGRSHGRRWWLCASPVNPPGGTR